MKVLQVSTADISGGAARAAYRLNMGLRRLGQSSKMLVLKRTSSDPSVVLYRPPGQPLGRLRIAVRRRRIQRALSRYQSLRPAGSGLFSQDRSPYGIGPERQLPPCDVANLHWVAGFLDFRRFATRDSRGHPTVWTLHDMNPFTGGCHYDDGCGRHADCCGVCPQLGSPKESDLSRHVWERKKRTLDALEAGSLHIVAPSEWLTKEARRSALLRAFPVTHIPNGLDTDLFSPRKKSAAREVLEIPQHAKVLLFLAHRLTSPRKGFALLIEALEGLKDLPNLHLITVGRGKPVIDLEVPHLHLGYVASERLMAIAYSAADVFVIPSLLDNLPNTVLESMACGTPVVGFDVGGIPEMVRPGITGMLAPIGNIARLSAAIADLLQAQPRRAEMSKNCRRIATEEYSLELQAERYVAVYREMLAPR